MGPPSTRRRDRRHRTEIPRLAAHQAAQERQRRREAMLEALTRQHQERERQTAALLGSCLGTSADTHWTGATDSRDLRTRL